MILREQLLQQALMLSSNDQAYLAQSLEDHLIANTPPQTPESQGISDEELLTELHRRSVAYRAGEATSRPAADVLAEMRLRQNQERAN